MGSTKTAFLIVIATVVGSAASGQSLIARLNAGGPTVTDDLGQVWTADAPFSGISDGYVGGSPLPLLSSLGATVVGGDGNPLTKVHATSRMAWSAYRFHVANGDYIVRLSLAEVWDQGPGLRSMDVDVEGAPFLVDLDLAAHLGVHYGGQVATLVHVGDGVLDVAAAPGPGGDPAVTAPILCGIEVWSAPVTFPGPAQASGMRARPGYGRNVLTWDWQSDPRLAGWRIWRAEIPSGPHHAFVESPPEWQELGDVWPAPPRHYDATAIAGRRYAYRVAAIDLAGNVGPKSAVVDAIALDPADSPLPRYQLTLTEANQLFIDQHILDQPDEEVPATFIFDGDPRPAETRYRGDSARRVSKKSWTVKFSSAEAFQGRRELNLKASFLDPGLIREDLAHRLFEAVGAASFDVQPVQLEVNGVHLGIFNEVEEIDEAWLALRDRNTGGDIFKVESDMKPLPSLASYQLLYEKKTNESTGHAELIALIEFLDEPPSPSFVPELADVFDLDGLLSYFAVIAWIADRDSVTHNTYLHRDLSLERWELLPWDNEVSLGIVPTNVFLSILFGTSAVAGPTNALRERVLAEPALRWRFCQKITEMEALFANPTWFNPVVDEVVAARRTQAHADPFKFGWESEAEFESDAENLSDFAAVRAAIVDPEIVAVQPATPPTDVWINELSAEAQTLFQDENGEFEDWLELYNAGAAPVDVSGMYLTDDIGNATKWQIPAAISIPAHGHLLVWCDQEPGDGPLHASFRLGAGGEELGLFDVDGATLLDFVSWNRLYPDQSYGRYQDGGQFFRRLATPTAGSANTTAGNLPPRLTWVSATPAVPTSVEAVEISCFSEDADGLVAVELHWRANAGSYSTLPMTALGANRYGATIPAHPDGTLVEYYVSSTDTLSATSTKPAAGAADPDGYTVTDPGPVVLRVNELLASNATGLQDEFGDFEDWIEIYNTSAVPIDMGGMFLSDDLGNSTKWPIPGGTTIAANGYLHVWADDEAGEGPLHATFRLSAGGENAALFDTLAAGNALIDGVTYGPQTADVSFGSLPDGGALRFLLSTPSPGASNLPAPGAARVYEHSVSSANPITLAPQGPAVVGGALTCLVSNAPALKFGTLAVGTASDDLEFPGVGWSLVASVGATVSFSTDGSGTAAPSQALPNDPGLAGVVLYAQAVVSTGGLSNGVVFTIGP